MKETSKILSSILCLVLGGASAFALDGTWKTTGGTWSVAGTWEADNIADGIDALARYPKLGASVTATLTLDSSRTIGGMNNGDPSSGISNGEAIIGSSGGSILTLQVTSGTPLLRALNGRLTLNVVLDGTQGAVFAGKNSGIPGIVTLGAANTYTGDTILQNTTSGGPGDTSTVIKIGAADAIPHGAGKGIVSFLIGGGGNYATLDLQSNDTTLNAISGDGGIITSSTANPKLTVGDGDASGTFAGAIENPVQLDKIGSGTLTLNGTVGTGIVSVYGGVLGGTGTLNGKVFVYAGGSIGAGASAGIIKLAGGLDLSAGGANIWQLVALTDDSTGTPGTDWDQIDYQWVSGDFDLTDSTLTVDLSAVDTGDAFWTSSHTWTIITSFGQTGGSLPSTINVVGGTPAGTFDAANNGTTVTLTFTPGVAPFHPPVPRITSVVPTSPTSVTINYTNTVAGTNYVVQYRTNLNTTNWTHLSPVNAGGTTSSSTDAPPAGSAHRFYRVYGQF